MAQVNNSDLDGLLDDMTPWTGPTFDARVAVIIRTHTTNGRGWCGACKRMVVPADHLVEQLQIHFTIRDKPTEEQRKAFEADAEAGRFAIAGKWLIVSGDGCTCDPHMGIHQPGCGYEPVGELIDIL